jgi:hypothetical protein
VSVRLVSLWFDRVVPIAGTRPTFGSVFGPTSAA